ncbi:hypothetical protein CEXT_116261 [Caerostris extrusa]|uniref:Uncharacterized protein n=1 Tax=Caerostris extrusa TaxID=172846 RepID=A0AAV4SSW8_CAEEX|nr:hypothetical protein CEXT_116261 [Caerostris extrusa]
MDPPTQCIDPPMRWRLGPVSARDTYRWRSPAPEFSTNSSETLGEMLGFGSLAFIWRKENFSKILLVNKMF